MKFFPPMIVSFRLLFASFLILLTPPTALLAHSVWLEPLPDGQLSLRFGEWGDAPETSPGHLDSLIHPTAITLKAGEPVPFTLAKKADHYLVAGSKDTEPASAKSDYAVMKRGDAPGRRPIFHARWWPASRPVAEIPLTTLDLLPSAAKPGQILVSFKGKPVAAGVELKFHAPGADTLTLTTDATGHVQLPEVKKAGLCLLTLGRHSEAAPGEFQGQAYEIASHSASLCWKVDAPTSEEK